jgi:hypothetical protein
MIHPKIENFISLLRNNEYYVSNDIDKNALRILKENGSTATEAVITLHQGFGFSKMEEVEKFVYDSELWAGEDLQDIMYQTFLYMNYNPPDPNFAYDKNKIKFPLNNPPSGKSEGSK